MREKNATWRMWVRNLGNAISRSSKKRVYEEEECVSIGAVTWVYLVG